MDGGACEATAFTVHGYDATGLCLPLENYHNMTVRGTIGPERIHLGDLASMIRFLEAIVTELESGDLELEASLSRFEEGVALSRRCADQLGEARQRIDVLVAENGELFERPFEADAEDDD